MEQTSNPSLAWMKADVIKINDYASIEATYSDLLRIFIGRKWRVIALFDLLAQRIQVHLLAVEWRLQGCHLEGSLQMNQAQKEAGLVESIIYI